MMKTPLTTAVLLILGAIGLPMLVEPAKPQQPPLPLLSPALQVPLDQTAITWSLAELSQTMFPATTSTATVRFRSNQSLSNVAVQVTPSLENILLVTPATFPSIMANQEYQLTLAIKAPPEFQKRSFGGTLHLVSAAISSTTYATPLRVNLRTDFQVYVGPAGTPTFSFPLNWTVSVHDNVISLVSPERAVLRASADESDSPVDITITLLQQSTPVDLQSFIVSYQNGWFSDYPNAIWQVISGRQARLLTDLGDPANYAPVVAAFVPGDASVIVMTLNDPENEGTSPQLSIFTGILSTLVF